MIQVSTLNSVIVILFDNGGTKDVVWVCENREAHDQAKQRLVDMNYITNIRSINAHVVRAE
jgi:hypothetical protein